MRPTRADRGPGLSLPEVVEDRDTGSCEQELADRDRPLPTIAG